jgi:hypothetical protein
MLSICKFLKDFWRVFCFIGHKPWHFICLRTEAFDFLFSFRRERTVGFMFYRDAMSSYFRVMSQRGCRISIFPWENFPSQFYSTCKKRSCLYFGWGKMLSICKFLKYFWRVLCFFLHNAWHFICLRTEADDFLFSFRGERTFGFMFYGDEMSLYFRVASPRCRRISIFPETNFHRNFIQPLQNFRVYIFGKGRCCRFVNLWKIFDAFSAFSNINRDILFAWELKQTIFFSLFGEKGPSASCFTEMRCRRIFVLRVTGAVTFIFFRREFSIAILFYA